MTSTFSLVVNHTPWVPERAECLHEMKQWLGPGIISGVSPVWKINDTDFRGTEWQQSKVQWALDQWRWAAEQKTTHHVFMTDDLHIAPHFWNILSAMVQHVGDNPIGLLSNHPLAVQRLMMGDSWYATNSWIVGPAYVLSHAFLLEFLPWFEALSDGPHTTFGTKSYRNDDSSLNEFVSHSGRHAMHPLPTIIEHRGDIGSTVGHGDKYSRERVSWRAFRGTDDKGRWCEHEAKFDIDAMTVPDYWAGADMAPLLKVGEE